MRGLALVMLILGCGSAAAQSTAPPQDLRERVRACTAVPDTAQRLICYDQIGAEVAQTPPEAWSITLDRERVQTLQRESFGLSLPNLSSMLPDFGGGEDANVDRVELTIARIVNHGDGRFTFVMDNGQRWTQTESQRVVNLDVGDSVTIREGAMTSYILTPSNGGRSHRVRREN